MTSIKITKHELNLICDTLDKFTDTNNIVTFEHNSNNGIGYTLDIRFGYKVNGIMCDIIVPITGVDSW